MTVTTAEVTNTVNTISVTITVTAITAYVTVTVTTAVTDTGNGTIGAMWFGRVFLVDKGTVAVA